MRIRRPWLRFRDSLGITWLRPEAKAAVDRAWADWWAGEPSLWDDRVAWWAGSRLITVVLEVMDLMAQDAGTNVLHPLLDPRFLAALSHAGGHSGFGSRTARCTHCSGGSSRPRCCRAPTRLISRSHTGARRAGGSRPSGTERTSHGPRGHRRTAADLDLRHARHAKRPPLAGGLACKHLNRWRPRQVVQLPAEMTATPPASSGAMPAGAPVRGTGSDEGRRGWPQGPRHARREAAARATVRAPMTEGSIPGAAPRRHGSELEPPSLSLPHDQGFARQAQEPDGPVPKIHAARAGKGELLRDDQHVVGQHVEAGHRKGCQQRALPTSSLTEQSPGAAAHHHGAAMEDHLTAPPCEHSSDRRQQRVHQAPVVPGVSGLERRGPAGSVEPRNPTVFKSDRGAIAAEHGRYGSPELPAHS